MDGLRRLSRVFSRSLSGLSSDPATTTVDGAPPSLSSVLDRGCVPSRYLTAITRGTVIRNSRAFSRQPESPHGYRKRDSHRAVSRAAERPLSRAVLSRPPAPRSLPHHRPNRRPPAPRSLPHHRPYRRPPAPRPLRTYPRSAYRYRYHRLTHTHIVLPRSRSHTLYIRALARTRLYHIRSRSYTLYIRALARTRLYLIRSRSYTLYIHAFIRTRSVSSTLACILCTSHSTCISYRTKYIFFINTISVLRSCLTLSRALIPTALSRARESDPLQMFKSKTIRELF